LIVSDTATATQAAPVATGLAPKFADIRTEMNQELVERSAEVDLVVRMLLARVHGVLLGSWGVAKSMLIREMLKRITDAILFETLLVKNSPAEQVVGPVSLKALENDEFKRITKGKLPEANVAFLDEIFKSNATVLNNLLSIINERKFHNNGAPTDLPHFSTVYGASNELPVEQREELGAFYDRLAVRMVVNPVQTSDGIKSVLRGQLERAKGNTVATAVTQVTWAEVEQAQDEVQQIDVPENVLDTLVELHTRASGENLGVSLRRMGEGVKLMQAAAWLRGANAVVPEDARVYEHLLWDDPDDRKVAYELTLEFAGNVAKKAAQIRGEYEEVQKELNDLQSQMPTDGSAPGGDLVGQIGRVSVMFKQISDRVHKQVEAAKDDGHDPHELEALEQDIATSRQSLNQMIGMDI
jgi:MoxR-like ATPase